MQKPLCNRFWLWRHSPALQPSIPSGGTAQQQWLQAAPEVARTAQGRCQLGTAPSSSLRSLFGGCQRGLKPHSNTQREKAEGGGEPGRAGRSEAAAGAALGQEVAGRGLLQQRRQDALQLRQPGPQRRAGEQAQLVGRVQGQDGQQPPAPRRAVC